MPARFSIILNDGEIDAPSSVEAGEKRVTIRNEGTSESDLVIVANVEEPEGPPPDYQQLLEPTGWEPIAPNQFRRDLEGTIAPGERVTLTLAFVPGFYMMWDPLDEGGEERAVTIDVEEAR